MGTVDSGFRISDLGFGIPDLGFRIWDSGFGISEFRSILNGTAEFLIRSTTGCGLKNTTIPLMEVRVSEIRNPESKIPNQTGVPGFDSIDL